MRNDEQHEQHEHTTTTDQQAKLQTNAGLIFLTGANRHPAIKKLCNIAT